MRWESTCFFVWVTSLCAWSLKAPNRFSGIFCIYSLLASLWLDQVIKCTHLSYSTLSLCPVKTIFNLLFFDRPLCPNTGRQPTPSHLEFYSPSTNSIQTTENRIHPCLLPCHVVCSCCLLSWHRAGEWERERQCLIVTPRHLIVGHPMPRRHSGTARPKREPCDWTQITERQQNLIQYLSGVGLSVLPG